MSKELHAHYQGVVEKHEHSGITTHSKGISLLPGDGGPPGCLANGLRKRLRDTEHDEHQIEHRHHRREDDHTSVSLGVVEDDVPK